VRLLTHSPSIHPRSRQLPYLSPRLTDPWPPRLVVSPGHARGASLLLHWFKILPFVFHSGPKETHYRHARRLAFSIPEVRHTNHMTCGPVPPCHRLGSSSAAAPRRRTTGACDGSLYRRVRRVAPSAPEVWHTNRMTCGPGPPCHRLGCLGPWCASGEINFLRRLRGARKGFPNKDFGFLEKGMLPACSRYPFAFLPNACAPLPSCSSVLLSHRRTAMASLGHPECF
jgi:hypothetical protein